MSTKTRRFSVSLMIYTSHTPMGIVNSSVPKYEPVLQKPTGQPRRASRTHSESPPSGDSSPRIFPPGYVLNPCRVTETPVNHPIFFSS
ncbi:hypothetical protein BJV78DRAFT_1212983 [Lactifluus subvellereus]|nr:hypothetical protein BJV78DRAFT_1212983 [Lactifluus subvellereus]